MSLPLDFSESQMCYHVLILGEDRVSSVSEMNMTEEHLLLAKEML